jgi:hypothetical protein
MKTSDAARGGVGSAHLFEYADILPPPPVDVVISIFARLILCVGTRNAASSSNLTVSHARKIAFAEIRVDRYNVHGMVSIYSRNERRKNIERLSMKLKRSSVVMVRIQYKQQ